MDVVVVDQSLVRFIYYTDFFLIIQTEYAIYDFFPLTLRVANFSLELHVQIIQRGQNVYVYIVEILCYFFLNLERESTGNLFLLLCL